MKPETRHDRSPDFKGCGSHTATLQECLYPFLLKLYHHVFFKVMRHGTEKIELI